jgi:hypothetical protein
MLERNKEISKKNLQMQAKLEMKDQLIIKAENGKKVLQDKLREKAMSIIIEHDKVKDLQQTIHTLEDDLMRERAIKQEYESQLKRDQSQ